MSQQCRSHQCSILVAACLLVVSPALRALEVTGQQVAERVEKVMKAIDWQESLAVAQAKAQKEKKLVFWMQLVGDLDGGL